MNPAWAEAKKHFVGGVNSPVRAFKAVGSEPIFVERALGPYLYDNKNKPYVDYCLSWGAILFGHADEATVQAIQRQSAKGTSFGTVTEYETKLALEIKKAFPKMEKIRFTSSGTEAVMSAVRLARGITKKERIVKFEGCYHGHADSLLVKAGSGLATFGTPNSSGVPESLARLTAVLPYNDPQAVRHLFREKKDIACVLVEPIAGNMGVVPAQRNFLETLRQVTRQSGALLIFDEVITGFRVGYGGVQHLAGIEPDLTVLGKIIGGGLPIGALGGRAQFMNALSPEGDVYQAGTLSGNPLSMAAGFSVLSRLSKEFYKPLNDKSSHFLKEAGKKLSVQSAGSMFTIFFTPRPPKNFKDVLLSDQKRFRKFFHHMLQKGIYFPPSAYESSFLSASHGPQELKRTLEAIRCFT